MGRSAPSIVVRVRPEGSATATAINLAGRVTSLSFSDEEKQADKLELTVDNFRYENFNEPVLVTGGVLEFQYGYADGDMSPVREAVITKITGGAQLKIEATGKVALMNTVPRVRSFRGMKRSEVVAQIADENGYSTTAQFITDTEVVFDQISQARLTDAQLIRSMANKEGFEFFVDHRGLHFHARDLGQAPRRKFIYYNDPGAGDILTPPVVKNDVTAKAGAIAAKGIDLRTKEPIDEKADNESTAGRSGLGSVLALLGSADAASAVETPPVGASTRIVKVDATNGIKSEGRLAQDAVITTSEKTAEAAKRTVDGLYKRLQLSAVQLTFSAVGDPLFEAKTLMEIEGLGQALSGRYYCVRVKHTLGTDYRMEVESRRDNSITPATAGGAAQSQAAVNTQNAPAGAGSSTDTEMVKMKRTDPASGEVEWVWVPKGTVLE